MMVLYLLVLSIVTTVQQSSYRLVDEKTEEIDADVETLDQAKIEDTGNKELAPRDPVVIFGRLHPALVHFPIAWIVLLLLLECMHLKRETKINYLFLNVLPWLVVASFIPALISGFLRFDELPQEQDFVGPASIHRNLMLATFLSLVLSLVCRFFTQKKRNKLFWQYCYLGLLVLAVVLGTLGGHEGGELVYGDDHLPF